MTHLSFSAPVKTVARDAGIVLHTVDHAINSRAGKTALNVAGMVPGPIGGVAHGVKAVDELAHKKYLAAAKDGVLAVTHFL